MIADRIINFGHIQSEMKFADMLSKPLANDAFHALVKPLLFHVPKAGRAWESPPLHGKWHTLTVFRA